MRLTAFAELERLSSEGSLVDPALGRAGEGHAVVVELNNGVWCLLRHVMNGILRQTIIIVLFCLVLVK